MTEATATDIAMGADVPEWLAAFEPGSGKAVRDRFRFGMDVLVFETPERFYVVPKTLKPGAMMDAGDTAGCVLYAGGKQVMFCLPTLTVDPKGDGSPQPFMPDVLPNDAAPAMAPPKAKPTLWQRLVEKRGYLLVVAFVFAALGGYQLATLVDLLIFHR